MAKFSCRCGNIIHTSGTIPNPNEWELISDKEYSKIEGSVDAEELYSQMKSMFVCDQCQRLWIFWDSIDGTPISYKPEKD